ncbi:MAG: hemerythrin family protein [Meiothermus sp.]|nr:hemerythrin family protein [Meiothermus sp.]
MPIQWSEQYEVGDTRTDRQHQNLFEYVNRIERLIEQGQSGKLDRREVEDVFVFLDAYVNTHFAYEELCMALRGCKVAQRNKEAHNKFLQLWANFNQEHKPESVSVAALEGLHALLADWLTQHICKIDTALRNTA